LKKGLSTHAVHISVDAKHIDMYPCVHKCGVILAYITRDVLFLKIIFLWV